MLRIPLHVFRVTTVMKSQRPKETQVVVVKFSIVFVAVQRFNTTIFYDIIRKIFTTTDGMTSDLGNEEGDIGHFFYDPF